MTKTAEPRAVEPREGAPLDIRELPDWWDEQRALGGKPDKSTCAAELRRALANARPPAGDKG